jgi:hypothetical protein
VTRIIPTDSEEARHEGRGVDTIRERSPEAAEAQLERFITQRDEKRKQTQGERLEEELYAESVRRFHERARAERRAQWIEYHECMCRLHTQLAGEHQQKAEKLLMEGAA